MRQLPTRIPEAPGFEHAVALLCDQIVERYAHWDLILFLPDGDGQDRSTLFAGLEDEARSKSVNLLCCAAVPEAEIWLLAGHLEKLSVTWPEARSHVTLKESVFQPMLAQYGDHRRAGGGRDMLMKETLANYAGLLARCPELKDLQQRIAGLLG